MSYLARVLIYFILLLLSRVVPVIPAHADVTGSFPLQSTGITVPFDYNPPLVPYPVVALRINGHAPLPFLIDTGTNDFVIQPWAVTALGLTPKTVASSADGSVQQQIPALKARLEDAKNTRHLDVSVTDARVLDASILNTAVPGTRLAGIASFGFFAWSVFRLDFAAKTLTIFPPTNAPFPISGATAVPLSVTQGALPALPMLSNAAPPDSLILDTGTLGSQVPQAVAETLSGARQTDYAFTERASTLYVTPQLHLDDLPIGPLQIPNVLDVELPADVPASLGLNVLSHYRLTIDAPHHQCFFEPSSGPFLSSIPSGIILTKGNGGWTIASIDTSAPAAKAGLVMGDTLLAIAGHAVDGAAKHTVQSLLYGIAGTSVQVTIQRASGAVQNMRFVRAAFTPSLRSPLTGLMLKVVQGGPMNVLDVSENCPAYTAGLRADDKITTINGKSVATSDFGQIADLLDAPKLTLSITRKGVTAPMIIDVSETSVK